MRQEIQLAARNRRSTRLLCVFAAAISTLLLCSRLTIRAQIGSATVAGRAVEGVSTTAAAGARRLRLLVRIVSPQGSTFPCCEDLMQNIKEIWRAYAQIDFAEIGATTAPFDDELRLVVTERAGQPARPTAPAVLGWIEFLDGRPQNTITVSIAAARALMSRTKWLDRPIDVLPPALRQRLMSRAISLSAAHEIGHYLLRSSAHAVRGLMRERITAEEIMDRAPGLNRLLPAEIASLDQRMAAALARAPTGSCVIRCG